MLCRAVTISLLLIPGLCLLGCDETDDVDGGRVDARVSIDGGRTDAGAADSGRPDAGRDSSVPDAGRTDAGPAWEVRGRITGDDVAGASMMRLECDGNSSSCTSPDLCSPVTCASGVLTITCTGSDVHKIEIDDVTPEGRQFRAQVGVIDTEITATTNLFELEPIIPLRDRDVVVNCDYDD